MTQLVKRISVTVDVEVVDDWSHPTSSVSENYTATRRRIVVNRVTSSVIEGALNKLADAYKTNGIHVRSIKAREAQLSEVIDL